ncbi:LOW QUALITY PROTEIN: uncharacterized protein ACR2FA_000704 [Aphomia sociella]
MGDVENKPQKVSRVPKELINIIYRTANLVNIQDIEYKILNFDNELSDYILGDTLRVIIKGYRDGQKIQCAFIIKWNSQSSRCIDYRNLYNREHTFYYYIVPKLLEIQKHFKIIEGLKMRFSNCIDLGTESDREYIVLSAMPTDNKYRIRNRFCKADLEHSSLVIKELAKLHALFFGKKPVDVLLIDYQLSRCASPVTDISYFLYMSADGHFLAEHYDRIINLYYRTLAAVLRQCNQDVQTIYPYQVFQQHLRQYSVLGLIESLISMKIITALSENAEMRYEVSEEIIDNEIYVERVNGIVKDFFKRNYSLDAVLKENI